MPGRRPRRKHPSKTFRQQPTRTIQEHNKRAKFFSEQRLVLATRNALIYECDARGPRRLALSSRDDWDSACGCPAPHAEDLDMDSWFEGEPVVTTVDYFPGMTSQLSNAYDIISLPRGRREVTEERANKSLLRMFTIIWGGNLIVIKRTSRGCRGAMHITHPEVSLINALVEWSSWLEEEMTIPGASGTSS
ncbi:hypothetical protein OH77DRAFT_1526041 [Trametes cingulata]|nr:hypothetical protein OH77DRAFT_1526041 [Trametes cingulata]